MAAAPLFHLRRGRRKEEEEASSTINILPLRDEGKMLQERKRRDVMKQEPP